MSKYIQHLVQNNFPIGVPVIKMFASKNDVYVSEYIELLKIKVHQKDVLLINPIIRMDCLKTGYKFTNCLN